MALARSLIGVLSSPTRESKSFDFLPRYLIYMILRSPWKKNCVLVLGLGAAILPLLSAATPAQLPRVPTAPFSMNANGTFSLDGVSFHVSCSSPGGEPINQSELTLGSGAPRWDAGGLVWETQGTLSGKKSALSFSFLEQFTPAQGAFRALWKVNSSAPSDITLRAELPMQQFAGRILRLDGVAQPLPVSTQAGSLFSTPLGRHTLVIPLDGGTMTIEGEFSALIKEGRSEGVKSYDLHLGFVPGDASCQATLDITARYDAYHSQPLSLRGVANRGVRDEIAGDHKGGWTDQGPDNDLSPLKSGHLNAARVNFEVIDPAGNDGRSVLVLGQVEQKVEADAGEAVEAADPDPVKKRDTKLDSATVHLDSKSAAAHYRNIYLLHAAANPPAPPQAVGTILVRYADGSETRSEVVNKRDIGSWVNPASAVNASTGWTSENPTANIGLYVSRFPVEEKPISTITFEQSGVAPWMIVGLSASTQDIPVGEVAFTSTITAGKDWAPYAHSLDIMPGSVFDFSSMLHAPAGKYGALRATPAGHFEFENRPGERVRFWGVNLCFTAQFLEKDQAEKLADRLARSGYNTVRFHHFDKDIIRKGGSSWDLDTQKLDQLDYLFAALKKRGIYLSIDLYSSRGFSEAETAAFGIPQNKTKALFKSLVPISEAAFDSWARYATNLLTHKNPYTGLTWAEDPALIGICPLNENPLFNRIDRDAGVRALYDKAFLATHPGASTSGPAFNQFIHETNARSDERLFAHLRSLGTKALLTGANYTVAQGLTFVRKHYDYVDCHGYWDHPKFPVKNWAFPIGFGQGSPTSARAKMPARIMPTRVFGRPFTVTEFNFCRPNQNRAEGAILMPAYASLQDWDGLYNFQYAMSSEMALEGGVKNYFAIAADPIGLVSDRVGSFLFQRGDISPAHRSIAYAVRPDEAFSELGRQFPGEFAPIGLVSRIGSLTGYPTEVLASHPSLSAVVTGTTPPPPTPLPSKTYLADPSLAASLQRDGIIPKGSINADGTRFISDTRQIELHSDERTVKVVTPRSELFLLASGSQLDGDRVSAVNSSTSPCVISVISRDTDDVANLSLATAHRILVTHLTDALPEGMEFANSDRKLLTSWGKAPHLIRRGEATLTLRLPDGDWKAWSVDATGKRQHEVPFRQTGDGWILKAETITAAGTQLAYELVRP